MSILIKKDYLFVAAVLALAFAGCKGASQSKQNDFIAADASGNSYVMIKITVNGDNYAGPSNITPELKQQRINDLKDPIKFNNKATCYFKAGPFSQAELTPYNPAFVLRSGKASPLTPQFVNADDLVNHLIFWGTAKGLPAASAGFLATTLGGAVLGCGAGALTSAALSLGIFAPLGCVAGGVVGGLAGVKDGIGNAGALGAAAGGQSIAGDQLSKDKQFVENKIDMKTFNLIADGITDYVMNKPNPYGFSCPFPTEVAAAAEVQSGSAKTVALSVNKLDGTTPTSIESRKKLVLCLKKPQGISADDAKLDLEGCMKKYAPVSTGEKTMDCKIDIFATCLYGLNTAAGDFADKFTSCTDSGKRCTPRS